MRRLDLEVYEPDDTFATLSEDGIVLLFRIAPDGMPTLAKRGVFAEIGVTPSSEIEELELTVRTYNLLKREGVNTVGQMLAFYNERGPDGLSEIRNFSSKSVAEVTAWADRLRQGWTP